MAQLAMPPVKGGSPQTTITADINQSDTRLDVANIAYFPDVGSTNNFVTIWTSRTVWEVCQYTAKVATTGDAGYLTIVRSGAYHFSSAGTTALSWTTGAKCARNIGKPDFDILQNNISDHETRIQTALTQVATTEAIGLVRVGDGLSVTAGGILSADAADDLNPIVAALVFG